MLPILTGRSTLISGPTKLALALALVLLAASDVSAQHENFLARRNREFYGPDFQARGYGDSLGLSGHKKLVNGGYYGPPRIYSRQYGQMYGYRTELPFTRPQGLGSAGYGGNFFGNP